MSDHIGDVYIATAGAATISFFIWATFTFGGLHAKADIRRDCETFGVTEISGFIYECSVRGKRR